MELITREDIIFDQTFINSFSYQKEDLKNCDYHGNKDYISASGLKKIKVSPLHYKEEEKEETDAMVFGSAYHAYILEPEKFKKEYYVFDDSAICELLIGEGSKSPRATNKYKEWSQMQNSIAGDRIMLDQNTFKTIEKMKERLFSHRYAKKLLSDGEVEQSFMCQVGYEDKTANVKFRPDLFNTRLHYCLDLKTTSDASVDGFTRNAAEYDYHIQAALYVDLLEAITGDKRMYSFYFIAQEKKAPYAFNIFEASPQFIGQGRYEYEQLIKLWNWCVENNRWPGYQVFCENKYGVNELSLPKWNIKEINFYNHKF